MVSDLYLGQDLWYVLRDGMNKKKQYEDKMPDITPQEKKLAIEEDIAKQIIKKILKTLVYIHSKDIVHRDIKPENIIFVNTVNTSD